jgi:hypothetical protein
MYMHQSTLPGVGFFRDLWEAPPTPIPLSKGEDVAAQTESKQTTILATDNQSLSVATAQKRQKAAATKTQSSSAQRLTTNDFCRQKSHRDKVWRHQTPGERFSTRRIRSVRID